MLYQNYVEPRLIGYKQEEKRKLFDALLIATNRAVHEEGVLRYSRNMADPEYSKVRLQVIEAAVASGLFESVKSPKGSPRMSRLIPTDELLDLMPTDPWAYENPDPSQPVRLVERNPERSELPVDPSHPTVVEYTRKLKLVNEVNTRYKITARRLLPRRSLFGTPHQLRPVHYAVFTGSMDLHGRLYTGRFGHQALRAMERQWICFDGEPSVELDYSAFHPRMLYHLEGLECLSDPYSLWGADTTDNQREMVKHLLSALINADTELAAIRACNYATSDYRCKRDRKVGKELDDARALRDTVRATGLSFAGILPLARERHYRINKYFCSDIGVQLMNKDSRIALNVLYHFARRDIPCLGMHDSFIVPAHAEAELKEVMHRSYRNVVGDFSPEVKRKGE